MYLQHKDFHWMQHALNAAEIASYQGELPVGAVLVNKERILAFSGNATIKQNDPTAHAEMLVLRQAVTQIGTPYLHNTTLYVTLEPCLMCLGAIIHLQVQRVVFGAYDPQRGAAGSAIDVLQLACVDFRCDVIGGVAEEKSCQLLRNFFQQKRNRISSY